jgi:hypothetical protein
VRTRLWALSFASLTFGVSVVLGLPLLDLGLPWLQVVFLSLLASLAPLSLHWLWPRQVRAPHTSSGLAVTATMSGELVCTRDVFAEQTALLNEVEFQRRARWPDIGAAWFLIGPVCVALSVLPLFFLHTAPLRLLNLSDETLFFMVDQRLVATLRPTRNESPLAGRQLRVPAGKHTVTVVSYSGHVLTEQPLSFSSRNQHLFAPGPHEHCFWIETTSYGRAQQAVERQPLADTRSFWSLALPIDSWFAPNPPAVEQDKRSSGGQMTALRHGPCAPP